MGFQEELGSILKDYVGREPPLYYAERLTAALREETGNDGLEIYLKREDLNHTGAHKINNALGQALLCQRMMVRDFHNCIGKEVRKQALERWGGAPDILVACIGGGSNAIGLFNEFVEDQ